MSDRFEFRRSFSPGWFQAWHDGEEHEFVIKKSAHGRVYFVDGHVVAIVTSEDQGWFDGVPIEEPPK